MIAKTFGFSQLIYAMQCCTFKPEDIIKIERLYFKFLWTKKWENNAPDRIKRSFLKLPKIEGGLNCTDVSALDKGIKIRQYYKSLNGENIATELQTWLINNLGVNNPFTQEFSTNCQLDDVLASAIPMINSITKYYRNINFGCREGEYKTERINQALNTNLRTFFKVNNYPLALNYLSRLPGINTLQDLIRHIDPSGGSRSLYNATFNMLPTCYKLIKNLNCNIEVQNKFNILCKDKVKDAKKVSTGEFQLLIKNIDQKITSFDLKNKHNIEDLTCETDQCFKLLYKNIKDPKLRATRFRLLHGDIFCKERMKRFGMVEEDKCERCGNIETIRHQIYECERVKRGWRFYNDIMHRLNFYDCKVNSFEDVLVPNQYGNEVSETLKSIIIKMNIQIQRPIFDSNEIIMSALKNNGALKSF
jgi:hypothetical protein